MLLRGGERHGAWSRGPPTGRGGGWPPRRAARWRLGGADVRPGEHVAQQLLGDRADPAGQQPVQQRGLPSAGALRSLRIRPSSRSPPTMRPNRNSSSSTSSSSPRASAASRAASVARREGLDQVDRARPALPRDGLHEVEGGRRHLRVEQPVGQGGPVVGLARRVRQRPAQRELPVEQPRDREELVGQAQQLAAGAARGLPGEAVLRLLEQTRGGRVSWSRRSRAWTSAARLEASISGCPPRHRPAAVTGRRPCRRARRGSGRRCRCGGRRRRGTPRRPGRRGGRRACRSARAAR